MTKKGFTLIELLGVIVILSLLTLITSTTVTKVVKDSKSDLSKTQIEIIKSAAQSWGSENLTKLSDSDSCSYLTLLDLKNYGLLDSNIKNLNNNEKISDDLKIKITTKEKSGKLINEYEVNPKNIEGCKKIYDTICTSVATATVGNVPKGEYLPGDEYTCEVALGISYNFLVLSTEEKKVNLIMDRNIGKISEWCSKEDYVEKGGLEENWNNNILNNKGPITAINTLNEYTSSWINIDNLNEIYNDEQNNYFSFALDGKARLPKLSELTFIGCSNTSGSCPNWLKPLDSQSNFWLQDSVIYTTKYAWVINEYSNKLIGIPSESAPYVSVAYTFNIRPVITVPKIRIKN